MRFDVTILGSSSATPIFNRNPSAQILNVNERLFLIDCGEGTQQQLMRNNIRAQRIHSIFISHIHGDHYLGLVGLLSSLHLTGRTKPLNVYGPPHLQEIVEMQLKYSDTVIRYPLFFNVNDPEHAQVIFENPDIIVESIPLDHRIACTGFKFMQKTRMRKLRKDKIQELNVPLGMIPLIKRGFDYTDESGQVHSFLDLTSEADLPRSYAYISDTICNWRYLDQIKGVNTLYHESTFMDDMLARATETYHSTAKQAAEVAHRAGVQQLLLGHFSARYRELEPLLAEATSVFPESKLAIEGKVFDI